MQGYLSKVNLEPRNAQLIIAYFNTKKEDNLSSVSLKYMNILIYAMYLNRTCHAP